MSYIKSYCTIFCRARSVCVACQCRKRKPSCPCAHVCVHACLLRFCAYGASGGATTDISFLNLTKQATRQHSTGAPKVGFSVWWSSKVGGWMRYRSAASQGFRAERSLMHGNHGRHVHTRYMFTRDFNVLACPMYMGEPRQARACPSHHFAAVHRDGTRDPASAPDGLDPKTTILSPGKHAFCAPRLTL